MNRATEILRIKFEEGRQRNSRWSQRAFARRLGLSSGALSEVLQGKRPLSLAAKKKIATKLQLSPTEQVDFFENELPDHLSPKRIEYTKLSVDQFHLIADWWHFAILNLIKTRGFRARPKWIGERLGLPGRVVEEALARLFRLGHLEKKGENWKRKSGPLATQDELFDLSLRKSNLEDLRLMERSILDLPVSIRDHTSVTLVLNKKDLPRAKEMIRVFQDHFCENIERDPGDEVYRLSIGLFPLTKIQEQK